MIRPLRLEMLEDRRLLANIAVTNAYLVDGQSNAIAQAVVGERTIVRVDYTTSALPANASYRIDYAVDGVTLNFANVTSGAGQSSGSFFWARAGWFAESIGAHNVSVTVDAGSTVSESDESDNTKSFSFTPTTATPPVQFTWPESGVPFRDRTFNNYVDLDPTSGIRDWNGGQATYDGHVGLDFGAANNGQMDTDIPVLAAAPGTVVELQDGNYDRNHGTLGNVVPGGSANYVIIDHGGGWRSLYFHVRRDSIQVRVGDTVNRGDRLALEGSSGNSTGSHLHFGVQHNLLDVETFLDPNTYWQNPPPYVGATRYLNDSGITNYDPTTPSYDLAERPSDVKVFSQAAGQKAYAWAVFTGLRLNDSLQMIYTKPNGTVYPTNPITVDKNYGKSRWYYTRTLPTTPDAGTWTVEFRVNGVPFGTNTFLVNAVGAPEARIDESNGDIVLDGRFTPFDFGSVNTGAASPTLTFTLINHGTAAMDVGPITVPEGFQVTEGLLATLVAGASDTFTIGLNTATAGDFAGQVRVGTSDADEAEYNFAVKGTVLGALPKLELGISERHAHEGDRLVANVRRGGSTAAALTVNLASSDAMQATAPASVTIPAGDSSAIFFIDAVNDGVADSTQIVAFTASAANYADAKNTLDVQDSPAVTLSISPPTLREANGVATVTAMLSMPADQAVSVNLGFSGTAANGSDYNRSAASIIIPVGATTGMMTLTSLPDTLDEFDETIVVDVTSVVHATESGTQQVTATIIDDDALPNVTLSVSPASIVEATGTATVTATLFAVSGKDVTVNLSFSGTAANVSDYSRSDTQIVIPAGSTTGTVTLTAAQDTLDEANETIVVDISSVTNGIESGTQQVTTTIIDDDAAPSVSLSVSSPNIGEAAGTATVTATLSDVSGLNVTVALSFSGTATNSSDYTRNGTTIIIPAGATTGTITLTAVQDARDEADETIVVDISGVTNGTESGTQQVSTTIIDDDAPPNVTLTVSPASVMEDSGAATVTATLSAFSGLDVTVDLDFSGTATNVDDYTRSGSQIVIAAGVKTGTITLTAVKDSGVDPDESIIVDISSVTNGTENGSQQATVTIVEPKPLTVMIDVPSMSEKSGVATGTVSRGAADNSQPLVVSLSSSDTTEATVPASVTILANAASATFTISAVDDTLLDGTQTVTVTASAAGFISAAAAMDVTDFEALTITLPATSISEHNGATTATVTRTDPVGDLTVNLLSDDTTEAAVPVTVTIPDGAASVQFTILAVDDILFDGNQLVTITTSATGYVAASKQVTVIDEDILTPYRNPREPLDVDDDRTIAPLDALLIINLLNSSGSGPLPPPAGAPAAPFIDTDGDNQLAPVDALLVINFLNSALGPEGEASDSPLPLVSLVSPSPSVLVSHSSNDPLRPSRNLSSSFALPGQTVNPSQSVETRRWLPNPTLRESPLNEILNAIAADVVLAVDGGRDVSRRRV